jgi:hypothetical protein
VGAAVAVVAGAEAAATVAEVADAPAPLEVRAQLFLIAVRVYEEAR